MLTQPEANASSAVVIDLAAYRAKRGGRTPTASSAPAGVMWVPMMMMVLMPVPVAGSDGVHAG
jgi:hypothetical protein